MFFGSKNKCEKFFTYESREINISGLSANMENPDTTKGSVGIGKIHIKPEYEKVSERLKTLDLMQYSLCQDLNKMDEGGDKQRLIAEMARVKLDMLQLALDPEYFELQIKEQLKKKSPKKKVT